MGNFIAHRLACWRAEHVVGGQTEPRYLIACHGVDTTDRDRAGRRVPSWAVLYIGSHTAVLKQAIRLSATCETGLFRTRHGRCTPEAHIGQVRRVLNGPPETQGIWLTRMRVPQDLPLARALQALPGLEARQHLGMVEAFFDGDRRADYFDLIDRHADVPGGYLAFLIGPPGPA
jgi:hypothetical protein